MGRGMGHPARPRLSFRLSFSLRVAPRTAPDDRCPRALPSFFSDCLSRPTRGQGNPLSPFWGSGAREGTEGRPLASVTGRVRQGELGLSPLDPRVRPGRLAAPDGLSAGRSGSVRRAVGQHGRARARERGSKPRAGSRPWPQPGRLQHPDPHAGGSPRPSPARDRRPAPRPHPSPGPGGSLDGRAAALPDRRQAWDGDAFRAWREPPGLKAVLPAQKGRTNPQPHDPERYPARKAVERGSAGSRGGGAWPPATPHTPIVAWVFCTWQGPGSG